MKNRRLARALALTLALVLALSACAGKGGYAPYALKPNQYLMGEDGSPVPTSAPEPGAQLTEEDIRRMNGGDAQFVYSDEGYVTFLNGRYYDGIIKDQEDAVASLQGVAALLGLGAGSEFYCEYGETDPNGYTYYTFKQRYGEGTVQYATLRVIIDPEGYAAGLSSSFVPNLGIAEEGECITAQEAEQIIKDAFASA